MGNWRDSYRPARFFLFDGRLAVLILGVMLHPRWWTLGTMVAVVLFLFYFEKQREMDVAGAVRMIRSTIVGRIRPGLPLGKLRKPVDYDRIR